MPTEFGPVTLRFQLTDDKKSLRVSFEPRFRIRPKRVVLHVPPVHGLSQVVINGEKRPAKPGETRTIEAHQYGAR